MKGIIFTLDAIIAFGIIIAIISGLTFFRTEIVSSFLTAQRLHSVSEDILNVLYNSRLRDVANQTRLNEYLADKTLDATDLDKKPADVIGALWANVSKRDQAANISKDILENFIPYNIGYQIMIDNDDVYNSSDTTRPDYENASTRISSGRIISGYEKYKPVSGFVARAWATKISRTIIKTIPINLEWGSYTENLGAANRYWYNGYAPSTTVADRWAEIRKNFTLPTDANISYAYMQMAFDTDYANITINGNQVFYGSSLAGQIREFNITNNIVPGLNTINITFRRTDIDLGHFHPGCYIKMKYNTSEIESGSNETVFSADWIRGAPSANQIIPFYVNMPIKNVTAYVEVKDINAFLLLTLNYKYNFSNPLRNVLLYRIYPQPVDCSSLGQSACQSNPQCLWTPSANTTTFHATFEGWSTTTNCSGAIAEGWNDCIAADASAYWRATSGTASYNASSTKYHEGDNVNADNSTWITKCLDLSSYQKAYVTFWYNKTATSSPVNTTLFHATFDGWDTGSNCVGASTEGWNDCLMADTDGVGVWRGSSGGSTLNSSSTRKLRGSDLDDGPAYVTKCLDLSSYSKTYLKFDWSITSLDSNNNEYILIRVNKTGSSTLTDLWNSGSGTASWSNKEIDVTNNISSNTCFRIYCWRASATSEYCDLDDFKIIGSTGIDEKQFILINETGVPTLVNIWNSSTSSSPWTYKELNITDYISASTCIRYMAGRVPQASKKLLLDDFKVIGASVGACSNVGSEENVKNRSYELFFNDTGTLIRERNDAGSLLNTWFNTNVTINNVFNNMTNTLGIYADIRPPNNSTVIGHEPDKDWQYLGMFANNGTAGHANDYYCYITEKSNVTVYHDKERYGIEYGKIDITTIENFTTNEKNCTTKNNVSSCKDAVLNLTFPFTTNIFKARVVGTQSWGGNDNGYNFIWTWVNDSEPVEAHLVMDTDTPPGTFSYIPVQFFQTNKINIIRVGDKDGGRYLNTTISALMRNRLSIIEYSFLIPSQVPYGKIFENETDAINDAETRLNQILGSLASATVISKESFRVGGVPFMYGPFSFRVNAWV